MLALALCLLMQNAADGKLQAPQYPQQQLPFAVAKASTDGKSIAIDTNGRMLYFKAEIPVTRTVTGTDGSAKEITTTSTISRTMFGSPIPGGGKTYTQTYDVKVPVTQQFTDKDGNVKNVTTIRTEKRTRTVSGGPNGLMPSRKPKVIRVAECKFVDLKGQPVKPEEAARRLKNRTPILVATSSDMKIDAFHQAALNPEMMVVTIPLPPVKKKLALATATLISDGKISVIRNGVTRVVTEGVPYMYSVTIVETVTDEDGNAKQVPRVEQRQAIRNVSRTIRELPGPPEEYSVAECRFMDLKGNVVNADEVSVRLRKKAPVAIGVPGMNLKSYATESLSPDTLIAILPKPGQLDKK